MSVGGVTFEGACDEGQLGEGWSSLKRLAQGPCSPGWRSLPWEALCSQLQACSCQRQDRQTQPSWAWQRLRAGSLPSPRAGMKEKTCPAMRSRRWHQCLPQGAELCVPGHSKLFEQNMGWEASQAGMVPIGLPPPPTPTHIPSVEGGVMTSSKAQGLSQLTVGPAGNTE